MGSGPGGAKAPAVCYDGDAMRCPNCAGEVPAGSRFCGICGRNVTTAPAPPLAHAIGDASAGGRWPAAPAAPEARAAMSLFELPAARRPRAAKLALVLALDAILAAAGIVMILSYLDARKAPPPPAKPVPAKGAAAIEVGAPKAVARADAPTEAPRPARKAEKQQQATGNRQQATGDGMVAPVPQVTPIADTAVAAADDEVDGVSERLTAMVEQHEPELERCYQRVAKVAGPSDPLEGRIDLHVTVMPDGSARDVHAGENTTGSAQLADCVVSLFQSWTLPAGAAEPVELIWPLQFRAPEK